MAERRDSRLFRALAEELAARGMGLRFQAGGQSMRPTIGDGETIEVRPTAESRVKRGDIVLMQGDGGMKAHRVMAVRDESSEIVTRGDASQADDSAPGGRILGKVVCVERKGRSVELDGRGRAALQAVNRALYRVRAAMRTRAAKWRRGAAAVLVLTLGGLLAAPAAWGASDLSVTETVSPSVVAAGGTITYTITFTNTGTTNATTAALFMRTPANTTYASDTPVPVGWACATPGAGNAGAITCTRATFAAGTSATFVIRVTVNAGVAAGTQIVQNVNGTSNTADTNGQNNSASALVLVEPAGNADMALTMVANPATVFVSAPYTYNITVTDLGQANAANVTVTDTLPGSVAFVSATPSQGSCSGTTTITCTLGTVNFQATATVAIQVTAPSSGAMISNTASVSTTSTDPVASNNSATTIVVVQPIVCAMSARDGTPATAITGVVNTYYPPSGAQVVAAGQMTTSITVGTASGAATPIAVGDLLLIIQMQDAAIDSNNAGDYGDTSPGDPGSGASALNSAGLYEFVTASSAAGLTGPNTLTVTGTGANGGLLNTYTAAAATGTMGQRTFQVIRVPQYQAATLGAALTAPAWNGTVGGVLVLDVAGQLTLNGATVSMNAMGFRGGAGIQLGGTGTAGSANTDYRTLSTNPINASKAEGIAGTPKYLANAAITNLITNASEGYPNGSFARGAPGNAGGGGTDGDPAGNTENSGGGGGANGGDGGIGGYGWNLPGVGQAFGGVAFPANISAVVMGGGGGAGTTNNGTADPANANPAGINSSGAAGGGIILMRSGSAVGTVTLNANGQTALNVMNDGGGGGGAGGSIIFLALSGGLGTLTANANGGTGGSTWRTQAPGGYPGQRHGPGGGGGGGVILLSTGTGVTTSVLGGPDGLTNTDGDSFGSLAGEAGFVQTGIAPSQTPGVRSGAECALADLNVTDTATPNPVTPTNNITYTQTVTNSGPQDAVNASFTEQVPANTTFVSLSMVAGWTCVTPGVGGTGTITCTNPNFTNGSNANFMLVVKVNAGAASGTVVTDIASVTSGINDPNFSNNTATAQTVVSAATAADESITVSATPNPVSAGGMITYTVMVTNNGPAAAVQPVMTLPIVGPSTFQSVTAPAGWNCYNPGVGNSGSVVCRLASLAAGGSATFTIVTAVPAGTAGGTAISTTANIGSSTPDPAYANNNASTTVIVAAAGQADVGITGTVSPNPVLAGNNITYLLTVTNNGPSPTSAAAVMVMNTLPAGVTFVSATPTTGSCMQAAGVITCSLGTLAAGASVNITVVDHVNAGTAAGTNITSTFAESSTTSDPNSANNSVALSTVVAVPNDADVSVTKSGSPNPVNLNTTLVYTIQIRNNGPAVATNVMLTDTLPAAVTYVSSSSTQGTCAQAGGTVTCNNIGTMSVGQLVVVTINVTATTFSSGTLATNSVTISHSDPDSSSANNTATFTSTIQASTAVQLASFQAERLASGGVMVEWQTREESRNLGFHLYRLQNGTKTRLDTSLIAGAALMFRGGLPQHGAKTYRWLDASAGPGGAEYELESVDVDGTRTTHGPAEVDANAMPALQAAAANARTLEQLNRASAGAAATNARATQASPETAHATRTPIVSSAWLSSRPAVKLSVDHEGWYRVTYDQLAAAGMPRWTDLRSAHLYAEGMEQPFQVDGGSAGARGANAGIEFYGTGIDTPFSGTRVYWLVNAAGAGEQIGTASNGRAGNSAATSFPYTTVRVDHTTYFAALLNGENNDNFFGALVSTTPLEQDLTATNNDPHFAAGSLQVALQGATDGQAHRVSVSFNGNYVGEMDFYGLGSQSQTFPLEAGQVTNGTNAVVLTSLAGDNDYSLVQSISLVYGHTYTADGNWLRMTARGGDSLQVTGFTNPQIRVYDITDPLRINQVTARVSMAGGTYSAAFTAPGTAGHPTTLLAFSADQMEAPSGLAYHAPTNWGRAQNSADVVIITHPDFSDSLTPLVNLRRAQGHRVALVPVDDLYDEYNYGERSPFAIQNFLSEAVAQWRPKPQSVLLVGDASFDPRNYLGLGDFDFVPTRIIETAALKTASDDWFSDFSGSGFATLATGRLPVRTSGDAANVVAKIVGYENGGSPGPWASQVLLVGDQNRDYDFASATNALEQLLPPSLAVTKIQADGQDPSVVHQQLVEALNNGQVLVNFLGHGSVEQWSLSGYFADADAATLTNGGNLPFVVSMDCLSGFFHDVYTTSLAESLLLAPGGGAVAVWASSGFTTADPQATMDRALIGQLVANPTSTLGAAILKTKAGTTDSDVRRTWILFGDPAMRLRLPAPEPARASTRP